jgi:hypothetical protein
MPAGLRDLKKQTVSKQETPELRHSLQGEDVVAMAERYGCSRYRFGSARFGPRRTSSSGEPCFTSLRFAAIRHAVCCARIAVLDGEIYPKLTAVHVHRFEAEISNRVERQVEPPVGFEPTTPALQERCSGQLS